MYQCMPSRCSQLYILVQLHKQGKIGTFQGVEFVTVVSGLIRSNDKEEKKNFFFDK